MNAPLGQRTPVMFECAELPVLKRELTRFVFHDCAGGNLSLVHVQADNTLVQCCRFHHASFPY